MEETVQSMGKKSTTNYNQISGNFTIRTNLMNKKKNMYPYIGHISLMKRVPSDIQPKKKLKAVKVFINHNQQTVGES